MQQSGNLFQICPASISVHFTRAHVSYLSLFGNRPTFKQLAAFLNMLFQNMLGPNKFLCMILEIILPCSEPSCFIDQMTMLHFIGLQVHKYTGVCLPFFLRLSMHFSVLCIGITYNYNLHSHYANNKLEVNFEESRLKVTETQSDMRFV